jgi:hypothetical protein
MKALLFLAATLCAGTAALGQNVMVSGVAVLKDGDQPLGFTTVSIVGDRQLLANESGQFQLSVAPGPVSLRFTRTGYRQKDTTLTVSPNDSVLLRVEMTRLAIQLPAQRERGKSTCTNESPLQEKSPVLAELLEQVSQAAERVKLLTAQKPFHLYVFRASGIRASDSSMVPQSVDTILRRAVAPTPYRPKAVISRTESDDSWAMSLPEMSDLADTAFANNHCFHYAGQTRWEGDSVVQIDYEPVPWLDKEVDVRGSLYLNVDGYQLVASITTLNRIPPELRLTQLTEVTMRAKFAEFVSGIPVVDQWELTRRYRKPTLPRVELGQVFNLKWVDSTAVKGDTVRLAPLAR